MFAICASRAYFASFHGFLELALLITMISEGRRFVHD